jgi:putative phage-type endonuclease
MKIHTMPQRSEEWFAIRKSVLITASEMGVFLTKNCAKSAGARLNLITKKLAEPIYSDESLSGFEFLMELRAKEEKAMEYNIPVQRGNALEPEARAMYEKITGHQVSEVGFITDDEERFGCSPDGLIYPIGKQTKSSQYDGVHGVEIKCPIPETHMKWLLAGGLPEEHKCQVHGSMAVTGLSRWDFVSYCPGLPPLIVRVERDEFTDSISAGLITLHAEYQRHGAKLKALFREAFEKGAAA